ncbi:hypothetical protein DLJ47_31290 [Micromonospora sp. S4605]|uniref:hypothetical protein n=1 Tax=Micromonospora sp. S4605 TaxID=1420897 RepID=UPI000D700D18|nr:hypothetical protein [Micromonospora sp. S4605]PWU47113.1 hypothetical protein DLJ47_31290 [Micromonospora sp. S4605]
MTQPKTNRIPAPIYAAAGAGELALQQLRKLPTVVSDLGTKVVADLGGKAVVTGFELRQKANETLRTANQTAGNLREKAPADLHKLREAADLNKLREVADLNKLREVADLDRLREVATRNAAVVVAGAQAAQERALAAYGALVARGERVVGAGVLEAADTVNADIEATEATAPAAPAKPAEPVAEVPTPAEVAEVVEAKPAAAKKATTRARKTTAKAVKPAATPSAKLPRTTKRTRPAAE